MVQNLITKVEKNGAILLGMQEEWLTDASFSGHFDGILKILNKNTPNIVA